MNRNQSIDQIGDLQNLMQLSLEDNQISQLQSFPELSNLMELYLANNNIINIKEIQHLTILSKLIILDLSNNPICRDPNYRIITLYNNKKLKVLDGLSIENQEHQQAKDLLTGRLTEEMLAPRLPAKQTTQEVIELDLSNCQLRDFENVFNQQNFCKLAELNLSQNLFQTTRMLGDLPTLKILVLSQNKIETLLCPVDFETKKGLNGVQNLEILDISYNQLKDFYGLQFCLLKQLKILKADHNEINRIDNLENLLSLKELDVNQNKMRFFDQNSFPLIPLKCLKIDDNYLKTFNFISRLYKLQHLFANNNRLNEFTDIEKLLDLQNLKELELKGNILSKKVGYRQVMIKKFPNLIYLDGKEILLDEKDKVDQATIQDQKQQLYIQPNIAIIKGGAIPIKVNPVNFDGIFGGVKFPTDLQANINSVSYTHLTLPTKRIVEISECAATSIKKKKKKKHVHHEVESRKMNNRRYLSKRS
eukprot:TRINITY_DN9277_c0_g1_i1.p1 TRINITY_DN9277_c0_g1~~TRINITY_DN9277_c0_g1_i1.p1  ORF type:complete len:476 (+),score=76.82 TRINITY_DN9277_c0_g1_i1:2-1429(+)